MKSAQHCPYLPFPSTPLTAESLSVLGTDRGPVFYFTALNYAHSLWLQGLPARALLILDRAFGAEVDGTEKELKSWPQPYAAVSWILANVTPEHYISNPRIHYQHLATRVRGPRSEIRRWRAWGCWWITRKQMPHLQHDRNEIVEEASFDETVTNLTKAGLPNEVLTWQEVLR